MNSMSATKQFISKLKNICYSLITIILVLLAILLVGVRLIGITPYSVISGSMEPTYPVGSLIYVKSIDTKELKVNDIITFVQDEQLTLVTHRIVRIDDDKQFVYTKGDQNLTEDFAPVSVKNIVGVPLFHIPLLGYVSYYISQPPGLYILIVIAISIFVFLIYDLLFAKK